MPAITNAILSSIGKWYLYFRLRTQERVEQELEVKYEGKFKNAGLVLLYDLLMALAVVAVVGIIAVVLYFVVA